MRIPREPKRTASLGFDVKKFFDILFLREWRGSPAESPGKNTLKGIRLFLLLAFRAGGIGNTFKG
jgi:hypothetical protein